MTHAIPKKRIRCFIALSLPDKVIAPIFDLQNRLKECGPNINPNVNLNIKWTLPENMHITLKFLGDITFDQIWEAKRRLSILAQHTRPFSIKAAGIGFFPGAKNARIIWTGIQGEIHALSRFHETIEAYLSMFPSEKRPFKSHVTLGRSKGRIPSKTAEKWLSRRHEFQTPIGLCHDMALYKSDLKKTGAIYTPLARWRLSNGDAPPHQTMATHES